MEYRFIADVHLGKLTKLLRMLGFDTLYNNVFTTTQLTTIALQQNRVLLSRNIELSKQDVTLQSFVVTHQNPYTQLQQVVGHFNLKEQFQPFTRCLVCNGMLDAVSKENISESLLPNTALHFNEFWQCNTCSHIYWKGSHYDRMRTLAEQIKNEG